MGIVRFYSWLRNKNYRGVLVRRVPQNVSSFSFDFNGIIHNTAQLVYAYGAGENPARRRLVEKADPKILEAEFYQALATKLSELIVAVQPRETLVIAIDGVAPQAKIAQQRQRRFRSVKDSQGNVIFNSSSITPGTEFMKRLDNFLQRWIVSASKTLPPKVIYSSHMVPGEAEHKIYEMMRNGDISGDGAHVVYGMDADLIMLSLLSPLDRIFLMREDIRDVIDIDNLKTALEEDIPSPTYIDDFVVMIYLIGNDFLPHLPALNDMDEAIETLMRTYNMNGTSLTKESNQGKEGEREIDWSGLSSYLTALADEESRLLELESIKDVKHPSRMIIAATTKTETMKGNQVVRKSRFNPDIYRGVWYENALGLQGPKANDIFSKLVPGYNFGPTTGKIVEMVKSYLTGVSWVYRYYSSGKDFVNNDYVYRDNHSPLLSDIALVSKQFVPKKEDYEFNQHALEINPVHQLLSVLPPQSKDLLPVEVRHLSNPNSLIADYFPIDEILERDGFNTDWQGILLINFVNMNRIMDAVAQTSVFTPERIDEFSPVHNIVLIKDPQVVALEEKNRKFKQYLDSSKPQRGRGRGRGQYKQTQRSQGRGYQQQKGRGRGRGEKQTQRRQPRQQQKKEEPLPKFPSPHKKMVKVQKFEL